MSLEAPACDECGKFQTPELVNITAFGDHAPRWVLIWNCPNGWKSGHYIDEVKHDG